MRSGWRLVSGRVDPRQALAELVDSRRDLAESFVERLADFRLSLLHPGRDKRHDSQKEHHLADRRDEPPGRSVMSRPAEIPDDNQRRAGGQPEDSEIRQNLADAANKARLLRRIR